MATFDRVELLPDSSLPAAGAVFSLRVESPADAEQKFPDGWSAAVSKGSRGIIVRGSGPPTYEASVRDSLEHAHRGLDALSARGEVSLALASTDTDQIVWWESGRVRVIRVTGVATMTVGLGPFRVELRDADGSVVEPAERPAEDWHPSFRYFRLSQVTDESSDAFRNLYLAVESVLSTVFPPKQGERDLDWLRRALTEASHEVRIPHVDAENPLSSIDRIVDGLYKTARTNLFHAKEAKSFLPHDEQTDSDIGTWISTSSGVYLALARHYLGLRRPNNFVFQGGFNLMTSALDAGTNIHVTDRVDRPSPDEDELNPSGATIISLPAKEIPRGDRSFARHFLGTCGRDVFGALEHVGSFALTTSDGDLISGAYPDGELKISGFDRFEVDLGVSLINAQQPRTRYP